MRIKFSFLLFTMLYSVVFSISILPQNSKLERLTQNADIIVTGNISHQVSNWNKDKTRIYTEATLQVDDYLKGNNTGGLITITYLGGEVDGVGELYTHMPRFNNKEDVLVFLKKDETGYKVFDGEEGKIAIIKDSKTGEKMTTSNVQLKDLKTQIKNYLNK